MACSGSQLAGVRTRCIIPCSRADLGPDQVGCLPEYEGNSVYGEDEADCCDKVGLLQRCRLNFAQSGLQYGPQSPLVARRNNFEPCQPSGLIFVLLFLIPSAFLLTLATVVHPGPSLPPRQ